jgi:hypothetical protein
MRIVAGKVIRERRARVAREWIFYPAHMPERWRMLARRTNAALPQTVGSDEERYGRAAALACCLFAEVGALPEDMLEEFWGSLLVWRDEIVRAVAVANQSGRTPLNSTSPYDDEESASLSDFSLEVAQGPRRPPRADPVVSRYFRTLFFGLATPSSGSSCDGTSHLLVLQQLDVQVSLG